MTYLAKFAVVVDGNDLDPFEVASRAREILLHPQGSTWLVDDLDSNKRSVVDVCEGRIIEPEPFEPKPVHDDPPF